MLSEILPYMDIFPDEDTSQATVLWEGFTGVKKQNDVGAEDQEEDDGDAQESDISGDGIEDENVPDPPENQESEDEVEPNNQESDGITNEEAGLSE